MPGGDPGLAEVRWREENFLKYASENYGIDKICDYAASIEVNTKVTDNPARRPRTRPSARRTRNWPPSSVPGRAARRPRHHRRRQERAIPPPNRKITAARRKAQAAIAARREIPAKLPANQVDPEARNAVLRAGRRGLQMVLRLLAHNAEHWLATHLNAYLRDDDEYRAITRETIIRGLAGVIGYTPDAITVTLEPPGQPGCGSSTWSPTITSCPSPTWPPHPPRSPWLSSGSRTERQSSSSRTTTNCAR